MSLFRKKEKKSMPAFDLREYQPVIRASICTGKGWRDSAAGVRESLRRSR